MTHHHHAVSVAGNHAADVAGNVTAAPADLSTPISIVAAVVVLVAVLFYMLPTLIALARHHPSLGGISVINILLGWTLLGWVAALAWAASSIERVQVTLVDVQKGIR